MAAREAQARERHDPIRVQAPKLLVHVSREPIGDVDVQRTGGTSSSTGNRRRLGSEDVS
jgi:hypothetical protein